MLINITAKNPDFWTEILNLQHKIVILWKKSLFDDKMNIKALVLQYMLQYYKNCDLTIFLFFLQNYFTK